MKYNTKKTGTPTVTNLQGGQGFKFDEKTELISLLSAGMGNNFYEKETEREKRLSSLIDTLAKKDVNFIAKALVYYRSIVGQRSVTQYGAALLAKHLSGNQLGQRFYGKRSRNENKGGIVS